MSQMMIDGRNVDFKKGEYILDVARRYKIDIPTLCQHDAVEPWVDAESAWSRFPIRNGPAGKST